jgi:galactoside 2-L-fucosyltransferase 1/2
MDLFIFVNSTTKHNRTRFHCKFLCVRRSVIEHFLSTVGTFGWWTGWLAGGNVTYFKWPAREKTQFRRAFGKDFSDHFYPSWIGL